jgi:hypothetical protein
MLLLVIYIVPGSVPPEVSSKSIYMSDIFTARALAFYGGISREGTCRCLYDSKVSGHNLLVLKMSTKYRILIALKDGMLLNTSRWRQKYDPIALEKSWLSFLFDEAVHIYSGIWMPPHTCNRKVRYPMREAKSDSIFPFMSATLFRSKLRCILLMQTTTTSAATPQLLRLLQASIFPARWCARGRRPRIVRWPRTFVSCS